MRLTKESMGNRDTALLETENKATTCKIIDGILLCRSALNLNMQDIFFHLLMSGAETQTEMVTFTTLMGVWV